MSLYFLSLSYVYIIQKFFLKVKGKKKFRIRVKSNLLCAR